MHNSAEVKTLAAYPNRHALYRTDPDLQAAHAAFPWVVTWDDHDVANNYAGSFADEQSRMSLADFLRRRAAAYQAFYGTCRCAAPPCRRVLTCASSGRSPGASSPPSACSTRASTAATRRTATARGRRTGIPATRAGRCSVGPGALAGPRPGRLERPLGRARAAGVLRPGGHRERQDDARQHWTPGRATRPRARGPSTRSRGQRPQRGGAHRRRPRQLGQRGAARRADDPGSKRVATEFVGPSISTGGDGADQRADTARIRSRNPHIKFFNAQRGYLRCRVTASRWRTDYRVLDRVSRYGSGVSTRASFVVEDGRAALERLDTGRPSARTAVSSETETDRIRAEREAER